jgi:glycosyltransferase involved in cell wall biosynthesis
MPSSANKPIRILNIVARLNVGGPAIHVALITQRLNPRFTDQFESRLVAGKVGEGEGDMAYYALERGVTPIILPQLGRELHPVRDLATIWKLYRLIRTFKPHVVHTHTAKAGFVGRTAAKLAGVPVIIHTFHGHVFHGYFSPAKTRLFLLLERFTARFTTTIITLTSSQAHELATVYHIAPRQKFTVMSGGLELDQYATAPRKTGNFRHQWSIPNDAPLIAIVGRLVPVKNHALFLQAAALVHDELPNARFVIVGDGELRGEIESQVEQLSMREVVTFTGWQKDVLPVYSDSDALVISSLNEGTPFSVIEALAAGCPVIATSVGGLPDLLENGVLGTLTPPGDAPALAEAILSIVQQPPDTAALRDEVVSRFGVGRLVENLTHLYADLLHTKGIANL